MRTNILQTFMVFLCSIVYSQKIIVVDSLNKQPISFVKIQINKNEGLYSDENGFFALNEYLSDTLYLSHNLYSDFAIATKQIKDTIFLTNKANLIDEIILNKKEKTIINIDFLKKASQYSSHPLIQNTELISLVVPNSGISNLRVQQIKFAFEKKSYLDKTTDLKPVIRINLYHLNQDNAMEKLYSSEAFVIDTSRKNNLNITLSDQKIFLNKNGLYIGIESIGNINQEGLITNEKITVRPILTQKKSSDYSITTYTRKIFGANEKILPTIEMYIEDIDGKKIYRQLSFAMTLSK